MILPTRYKLTDEYLNKSHGIRKVLKVHKPVLLAIAIETLMPVSLIWFNDVKKLINNNYVLTRNKKMNTINECTAHIYIQYSSVYRYT